MEMVGYNYKCLEIHFCITEYFGHNKLRKMVNIVMENLEEIELNDVLSDLACEPDIPSDME